MINRTIYVAGTGIISALGSGPAATETFLRHNRSAISPLQLFPLLHGSPLPVGQVAGLGHRSSPPRTHRLALLAAEQAMAGSGQPPEAIIIGTTTGGIATTEQLLRSNENNKILYRDHGLNSVTTFVAGQLGCVGPVLTVSTACSSGAVAITMAMALLRSGKAATVLVGGVDSLSRLTYFGFHSLQLVDRNGSKPLDRNRQGMVVAEGAGMLLLSITPPDRPIAELLGAGLSCDAYHPAAPHPDGQGAYTAMVKALADAGLQPDGIGYINLHGTGTPDNDLAESKAVRRVFTKLPPLSSIKGASGHSLAASGAIEAVVSTIAVSHNFLPGNTGLLSVDQELGLAPLREPLQNQQAPVQTVLSNSFGFGGNNGSVIIGAPGTSAKKHPDLPPKAGLAVHGFSCFSGAGDTTSTLAMIKSGQSAAGMATLDTISQNLPPQRTRRLKRLPRLTLALAVAAQQDSGATDTPASVFMGTGWGALSETYDFLERLSSSKEQFPSPTDFVGSVHNSPAGQAAMLFGATGPNITASGGDYSFEQALLSADLVAQDSDCPTLLIGADEGHQVFSPLFDSSIEPDAALADGGAAFCLGRNSVNSKCMISIPFYQKGEAAGVLETLLEALGGTESLQKRCALIMAGIPYAMRQEGNEQLNRFLQLADLSIAVVPYRKFTGEFASASAMAAALAVAFLEDGTVPGAFSGGEDIPLDTPDDTILVLGFGEYVSAVQLRRAGGSLN